MRDLTPIPFPPSTALPKSGRSAQDDGKGCPLIFDCFLPVAMHPLGFGEGSVRAVTAPFGDDIGAATIGRGV